MSRTDKDRPYRVRARDTTDGSYIDHDHRLGECAVGSHDWSAWRHHYSKCKKREVVFEYCTKENPHRDPYSAFYHKGQKCWNTYYEISAYSGRVVRRRTSCDGHRKVINHPEIPCSCDNKPKNVTCDYRLPSFKYHWGIGGKKYRDEENSMERSYERRVLGDAVSLYNGGDWDEFDYDVPKIPARRGWRD